MQYNIQVKLIPSLHRLEGYEEIVYKNNSPDTLTFLYFHLYMNRFREDFSYDSGKKKNEGYIELVSFKNSENEDVDYLVDETILKVELNKMILPGDSQSFKIRFNTVLPRAGDRLGYYGDHYDVGNWYPVPAVYDQYGWHADQHINGEFYQEWGNFQVDITVPEGFVVAATGTLQNPEILPDSVHGSNRSFEYNSWSGDKTVTYRYLALRVHDFAWSADPDFVLKKEQINDVTLQFSILSFRMSDWEPQIERAEKAFLYFEKVIGKYPYPTLSIVDGYITAGGIEYPNLVIINDNIYDHRDLSATIIHEMAHQWFYGLLANNQTRYGWMDEVFATYFENLGMGEVYDSSQEYVHSPTGIWGNWLGYEEDFWRRDYLLYYRYYRSGNSEPINTHFDW
ncbi:MAG: M1 family metallopeptidase, partial [Anaerolineales bacterium]